MGTDSTLFRLLSPSKTGIRFNNELNHTEQVNPYTFRNFYNGAGAGIGDINNDGLPDIFLAGNMVSNRLYLNKGNLEFEDITEQTGVGGEGFWTTGISMADVNQDGLLDIYLCKSGPPGGQRRKNELFINQGNLKFLEQASAYGLDFEGLATQAVFLDFDLDGDPDCYLLNNSFRPVGVFDYRPGQRDIPDPSGGNRFLRNDNGKYTDITREAGIYSSAIGFGLGVTVGDVNDDGWPDMFVSNDYFEKDYLYINNGNGTFREAIEEYMDEISMGSMGADMADINNDGLPEIYVTEMLPEHDKRLKTNSQFDNWNKYQQEVQGGYFKQFGRNVLQLNNGDGTFSEIGRYAGVEATDWSWGALIFDMDNDGWKDIFVANGIYKDLLDQDYVNYVATPEFIRNAIKERGKVVRQLIDSIPSNPLPNYAFRNRRDLTFENVNKAWGLDKPTHSNGSAYGDLDNDGDLDLVINNVNMPASLYENRARQLHPENHYLSLDLRLKKGGSHASGARVSVWAGKDQFHQDLAPMRGFMSVVDPRVTMGTGEHRVLDSVVIGWPGKQKTVLKNVPSDTTLTLYADQAKPGTIRRQQPLKPVFTQIPSPPGIDFTHQENDYVDFDRDRLLFNMISNEGPCLCSADVDGNGLEDFYIGGAKGQSGALYLQQAGGGFRKRTTEFEADADSEDTDCLFFDANGDRRPDLYVASGGVEYSSSSSALLDRLYINHGNKLVKHGQPLPTGARYESTAVVTASDLDGDGDQDLFTGTRVIPFEYGIPCNGYVLINDGKGNFTDRTSSLAPTLTAAGMYTDGRWTDLNGDGKPDLVVTGEWMPLRILIQENGKLIERTAEWGLADTEGWYQSIEVADLNGDRFPDLIAGNHGLNSRFRASVQEPVSLHINDFDRNGTIEHILTRFDEGIPYPLALRGDMVSQMPMLKKRFLYFRKYAGRRMEEIFPKEVLDRSLVLQAKTFQTGVWLNRGGKKFDPAPLPAQAQLFPVHAISIADFDGDTRTDLLLGGNLHRAKPETGIYAAGHGLLLIGDGTGNFAAVENRESGLNLKGETRAFRTIRIGGKRYLMAAMNNDKIRFFQY